MASRDSYAESDSDGYSHRRLVSDLGKQIKIAAPRANLDAQGTPPTWEEFKKMVMYKSCRVPVDDDDDFAVTYMLEDDVLVAPFGSDIGKRGNDRIRSNEIWRARIKRIRCDETGSSETEAKVWVSVKWYYSPSDFAKERVKGFKMAEFGKKELILSDHRDIISAATLHGPADVIFYDESQVGQEDISSEVNYYRSQHSFTYKKFENPGPTCICKKRYNPDDGKLMHFCPRPACRKWHHTDCLSGGWIEKKMTPDEIELAYERAWDPADFNVPTGRPRRNKGPPGIKEDSYDDVPPELLSTARRPIIKGGEYGIVGNAREVLLARYYVADIVERQNTLNEDWKLHIWDEQGTSMLPPHVPQKMRGKVVAFMCPTCGNII